MRLTNNYIYGVYNGLDGDIDVKLDVSNSKNMVYSVEGGIVEKNVPASALIIMVQAQRIRAELEYKIQVKLGWSQ